MRSIKTHALASVATLVLLTAFVLRNAALGADLPGLKYDDASPAAIASNDRIIAEHLKALPPEGGSIELRGGTLHIGQPIVYPQHWFVSGSSDFRPLNFSLTGTVASSIHYHDATPIPPDVVGEPSRMAYLLANPSRMADDDFCIVVRPNYAANYPGGYVGQRLASVTLIGGGLRVQGAGKYFKSNHVNITAAPLGLHYKNYDGGTIETTEVYGCEQGTYFDTCMLVNCNALTVRTCKRDGHVAKGCHAWGGQLYGESNEGFQARFDRCEENNLNVWFEDKTGGGNRPLGQRRNCTHNVFSGKVQAPWDDDMISRQLNRMQNSVDQWPAIGEPVGTAKDFAAYGGRPLFTQDGLAAVCKPHALAQTGLCYGEIRGFDPSFAHKWKTGDWFQVDLDVVTSKATRDYFGLTQPLMIGFAGWGPVGKAAPQLIEDVQHVRFLGEAMSDGQSLRLFATMLDRRDNPDELRIEFKNVVVRYLRKPD